MRSRILFFLVLTLMLAAGCRHGNPSEIKENPEQKSQEILSGTIRIEGAYALTPLAKKWSAEFCKLHQGVSIEIAGTGTGAGINSLLEKKADLAMVSRPLTDEEIKAGIWVVAVAKEGIAPIVNSKNPYIDGLLAKGLSPDELQKIFTSGQDVKWSDLTNGKGNEPVKVYSRADESGAAEVFAGFLFRKATELKGTGVTGDPEMISSIQKDPLGIGFCNFSYAFDTATGKQSADIQVVPFDLDFDNEIDKIENPFGTLDEAHRSVWLGLYPDQLCRELTFGSIGKPSDPLVKAFLRYVLSEGQNDIRSAGLCSLNNVYLRYSLESF